MKFFISILLYFFSQTVFSQILFEEGSSSLNFNFSNSIEFGSGVSFCDFDDDGWDDITTPSNDGENMGFFKNNNGVFEQITLDIEESFFSIKQLVWIDYDNDGDKDLFLASEIDKNRLYQNNNFTFTDVTLSSGLPDDKLRTNSGSWGDYDNDGDLDLFLANRDLEEVIPNMLFRNNGDGTFTNVNIESGIGNASVLSFQGTFFDYNNDGFLDIFLINDRLVTENILYRNNGDATFTDVSEEANANYIMNAMSIALDDYNSDGNIDMYVTNTYNPQLPVVGNSLMQNSNTGIFTDVGVDAGVSFDSTSWGASFLDGDNDGRLDLYVSGSNDNNNGDNVSAAFYYQNEDESFTRVFDNGFETDLAHSFGNATGDINNDGFPDIVVANNNPYNFDLWLNLSSSITTNNYLKVNLEGVESNRDGYGSRIEISINGQKQYRVTSNTESYLSQNSDTEIFGLGTATEVDYLKITWLSGQVDNYENVNANQIVTAIEGQELLSAESFNNSEPSINLYPNPTSDRFIMTNLPSGEKEILIFDILGREIDTFTTIDNQITLEIRHYNSGTYLVQINGPTGESTFHKLLKR